VTFRPAESQRGVPKRNPGWNPLCAMATAEGTCGARPQTSVTPNGKSTLEPDFISCPIGVCDAAVPVRMGDELIGFLQTGIARAQELSSVRSPTPDLPQDRSATPVGMEELRESCPFPRVLSEREKQAIVKLLTLFAQHLSVIGNQILVERAGIEPPVISRAREYIARHYTEDLSLPQVARAVNTSTCYFCKLFKKHTGINFIDHVSRVRIEQAKILLRNPNLRVSEIAYEVGFQSLTHFNRVFKRLEGRAPTLYRRRLVLADPQNPSGR
jgi:AraC-like DNA-binding protein